MIMIRNTLDNLNIINSSDIFVQASSTNEYIFIVEKCQTLETYFKMLDQNLRTFGL